MLILESGLPSITAEESKQSSIHRQNNTYYVASEGLASWCDARDECLRLGGDLASFTVPRTIMDWSWLPENQTYWIGHHLNEKIWNSTGDYFDMNF